MEAKVIVGYYEREETVYTEFNPSQKRLESIVREAKKLSTRRVDFVSIEMYNEGDFDHLVTVFEGRKR